MAVVAEVEVVNHPNGRSWERRGDRIEEEKRVVDSDTLSREETDPIQISQRALERESRHTNWGGDGTRERNTERERERERMSM